MTPLEHILQKLRERGDAPRLSGNDWMCRCPAHEDSTPSLSIREDKPGGRIFVKCFAGCKDTDVLKKLGLSVKDLFPERNDRSPSTGVRSGLKLEELAEAKKLPVDFLQSLGVRTACLRKTLETPERTVIQPLVDPVVWNSMKFKSHWREVLIPYRNADGTPGRCRRRIRIAADPTGDCPKQCWAGSGEDGEIIPYGLDRLQHARDKGYLILVEGETDCWAGWLHGFPVLGIPGATNTKVLSREHLDGIGRVYFVKEPDQGGETFYDAIRNRVSSWKSWKGELLVIRQPGGAKDICDLRQKNPDAFEAEMERALAGAEVVPLAQPEEIKTPAAEEVDAIIDAGSIDALFDNAHVFARLGKADFGKTKAKLKDVFGPALNMRDFQAAVKEAGAQNGQSASGQLPQIVLSGQLRQKIDRCVQVLSEANEPPDLFMRGTLVARITQDRKTGKHIVQSLPPKEATALQERLTRVADFFKETGDGERYPCDPPRYLAEIVLGMRDLPFPPIESIVESPILRHDGSVLDTPGYDPASGLYFAPTGHLSLPPVAENPSWEDVTAALAFLDEAIGEFPFVCTASKANLLALLLTVIMRPVIDGCVPLALIDAPTQGTGKGLLSNVVNMITVGREPVTVTAPSGDNDDEWRKRITSTLLDGPPVIMLDNLVERLDTPSLAAVLTARIWGDRKLGFSSNIEVPARAVWFATANNVSVKGDMTRRCYWIRLDAGVPQPWQRSGFRHPNLAEWVREHRGHLLHALLTIARYWFVNGQRVWSGNPLGSFESWSRTIGGVLETAGIRGFLANSNRLYDEVDTEAGEWASFFEKWHVRFGERQVTTGEVAAEIMRRAYFSDQPSPLMDALPDDLVTARDKGEGNLRKRLGIALRTHKDGVFGCYRLVRTGVTGRSKVTTWRVEVLEVKGAGEPSLAKQAQELGLNPEAICERAAILEYEGAMSRKEAEQMALKEGLGLQ